MPPRSVTKLVWSEHHVLVTELAVDLPGAAAICPPRDSLPSVLGPRTEARAAG